MTIKILHTFTHTVLIWLSFILSLKAQPFNYNQEFQVHTSSGIDLFHPQVSGLPNGEFVICWEDAHEAIFAQRYTIDGSPKSGEIRVVEYVGSRLRDPDVCGLENGEFVICWQTEIKDRFPAHDVFAQLFDKSGTKQGDSFKVNTDPKYGFGNPKICHLSDGGFIICWMNGYQDGDNFGVFGQIFDSLGTKRGTEFQINSHATGSQWMPDVCNLYNDGFVVCWDNEEDNGIYCQIYENNGFKIGGEIRINDYSSGNPSIAGLTNGGFAVCWNTNNRDGSGNGIFGQLYDSSGQKIGDEFQINSYTFAEQFWPAVCSLYNDEAGFVVSWQSEDQDGSSDGIYAQVFEGNGTRRGAEFQINSYSSGYQGRVDLAGLINGNFVSCWQSQGYDGLQDEGIYGKYFLGTALSHFLNPFSIFSPTNHETVYSTEVLFKWHSTSDKRKNFPWEVEYGLFFDTSEEFYDPEIILDIYDSTFTVKNLSLGETYFWKVLAKNISGDSLWSSESFEFYINPAADIENETNLKPESYVLYQNYPNPFNPTTTINYELPNTNYVEIGIYDLLGQKVAILVSGKQTAGYHQREWDASGFASGVYYYQLITSSGFRQSRKLVLLR